MSDGKRPYRMRRRAELEEETRRRITESTVALHEELGPARTTVSAVAERAGVRRATVYRPLADAVALMCALIACSDGDARPYAGAAIRGAVDAEAPAERLDAVEQAL